MHWSCSAYNFNNKRILLSIICFHRLWAQISTPLYRRNVRKKILSSPVLFCPPSRSGVNDVLFQYNILHGCRNCKSATFHKALWSKQPLSKRTNLTSSVSGGTFGNPLLSAQFAQRWWSTAYTNPRCLHENSLTLQKIRVLRHDRCLQPCDPGLCHRQYNCQ